MYETGHRLAHAPIFMYIGHQFATALCDILSDRDLISVQGLGFESQLVPEN